MAAKFDPKAALLKLKTFFTTNDPDQNKNSTNTRKQRRLVFSVVATCLVLAFGFQNCTKTSSLNSANGVKSSSSLTVKRARTYDATIPKNCTVAKINKVQPMALKGMVITSITHTCTHGTTVTYPVSKTFSHGGKIIFSSRINGAVVK